MKVAQRRQKTYVDQRRRPLEFMVRDNVFLKVSSMKRIVCVNRNSKNGLSVCWVTSSIKESWVCNIPTGVALRVRKDS